MGDWVTLPVCWKVCWGFNNLLFCSGDEEDEGNDEPTNASDGENQGSEDLPSVKSSVLDEEEEEEGGGEEEEGTSENDQQSVSSSHRGASTDTSPPEQPTTENPSPSDSPSQSEPVKTNLLEDSQWRSPISPAQPITTNTDSLPPSPAVVSTNQDLLLTSCDTKATNGHPSPPSPVKTDSAWSSRKRRKSVDLIPQTTSSKRHKANSMRWGRTVFSLYIWVQLQRRCINWIRCIIMRGN